MTEPHPDTDAEWVDEAGDPPASSEWRQDVGLLAVLLALGALLSVLAPDVFPTSGNLLTILKQTSIVGILAIGMTMVIVSGGIDLSVGSIVALGGVVAAYVAQTATGFGTVPAVFAGLATGAACGLLNGIGIVYGRLPPFIMTLATMSSLRGLAYLLTDGRSIAGLEPSFQEIARGSTFGLFNLIYIYAFVAILIAAVIRRTVFGRHVYAVGSNERGASNSGVDVAQTKLLVYVIMGLLAGLVAVLLAARTTVGSPVAGQMFELDAIAAAIIGGASLSGGRGKVHNTIVGALIISTVGNGLDILGISTFIQQILTGVIVIAAVLMDNRTRERA